jgi:hypothetical protein
MPSRLDDYRQKVGFMNPGEWLYVDGGRGAARANDDAVLFAGSVRNVGSGIAVLHGWRIFTGSRFEAPTTQPTAEELTRYTRDIFVPAGDVGFWQATFRDATSDGFAAARRAVQEREDIVVDVMYGDLEGGQRTVTRFSLLPAGDDDWLLTAGRVWNIDRDDPR